MSKIDNRTLTNNPFGPNYKPENGTVDLTEGIESYLEDRIGFRDDMIYGYTMLHDGLFHEMIHPTYMYGKDGYIFAKVGMNISLEEYHFVFADMVKRIQDYCTERNVPFLFVFEPEKVALLTDELGPGINYNDDWVAQFEKELDKRGIHYIDNSDILEEKLDAGEDVFNKQYNANHWNDLGAFYGVNNILETMKKDYPGVHVNEKDEFDVEQILNTTLPVSEFPIHEYEPIFYNHAQLIDKTEDYDAEVKRDENFGHFEYVINEERLKEGSPKALVFQGSYMNEMGYKFMENSLGEYIAVHDYQNVIDFDYYYNIFKPNYVVFEAAQYVISNSYFDYGRMTEMDLNPTLDSYGNLPVEEKKITDISMEVTQGTQLITIDVKGLPQETKYAWLEVGGEVFDFQKKNDKDSQGRAEYEVTLKKDKYHSDSLVVTCIGKDMTGIVRYK
ncbi:MAG: hypothetical protein QM793_01235 [Muricomes sp.]